MESPQTTRVILFDLDNTFFDYPYSVRCAIQVVQRKYSFLAEHNFEHLVETYNTALQTAYDKYLLKEITYKEADSMKVHLFFAALDLPEPSLEEIKEFRAVYQHTYRANRQATPGSLETLTRLHEQGYRIGVVTNGQIGDQTAKVEDIGMRHLVDRILTSEEAGCCKPHPKIFHMALEEFNVSAHETVMVGDNIECDIKGAIDAGLKAVWYSPGMNQSKKLLFGEDVPVIQSMDQLLWHLGVSSI